jgi:hypothetical protein
MTERSEEKSRLARKIFEFQLRIISFSLRSKQNSPIDVEQVAIDATMAFLNGYIANGNFGSDNCEPEIDQYRALLVAIAKSRLLNEIRSCNQLCRNPGNEVFGNDELATAENRRSDNHPSYQIEFEELCAQIEHGFNDPEVSQVFRMIVQQFNGPEIASAMSWTDDKAYRINAPEGQQGCHDKQPLQIIHLTDPKDGVRKAVRINCHCECDAPEMGIAARCMLKDHLIGWPKPVDPNVIWGPSPE